MYDTDEFDPLDDLLLSDEELPKPKSVPPKPAVTFQNAQELDYNDQVQKEKKKKIIAELFGTDEENPKADEKPAALPKSNKSDWLDLKEDVDLTLNTTDDLQNTKHATSSMDHEVLSKEKIVQFPNNTNSKERRKSEIRPTTTLSETKKRFKSFDLDLFSLDAEPASEQLLPADNKWEQPTSVKLNQNMLDKETISRDSFEKEVPERLVTSYTPSTRENRRFVGSRPKRTQHEQKDWLSFLSPEDTNKQLVQEKKDFRPNWLDSSNPSQTISDSKDETDIVELPKNENISSAESTKNLREISEVPGNTESERIENGDLQRGDEDRSVTETVAKLKKKQDELKEIGRNQTESLTQYENEVHETAIRLMKKRTNAMKALLQLVAFDGYHCEIADFINRTELNDTDLTNFKNTTSELHLQIAQYKLEKSELEMKLSHMERKHSIDLSMLNDFYKHKLQMAEEKEAYYKNEIHLLEDEYIQKLSKRKEEEEQLIQLYNEKLKTLKEDHVDEIKHIREIHKLGYPWRQLRLGNNNNLNPETLPDKELVLRELAIQDKDKELLEFEERLSRQRSSLEAKEASLDTKIEEFELRTAKEKLHMEQQKKDIKLARNILEEKQAYWQRELQREKDHLSNEKAELELIKESLLADERRIAKEKFQVNAERARLETVIKAEGNTGHHQSSDYLNARAELHGTIEELRHLKSKLESERNDIKQEGLRLQEEGWRLREVEQHLRLQQKNVEKLLEDSATKREEGHKALDKAQKIESQIAERMEEVEKRATELKRKEDILMQEKTELSKERELLIKRRYQLDMVLPQLTYDEQLPFDLLNKGILDPKLMLAKFNLSN